MCDVKLMTNGTSTDKFISDTFKGWEIMASNHQLPQNVQFLFIKISFWFFLHDFIESTSSICHKLYIIHQNRSRLFLRRNRGITIFSVKKSYLGSNEVTILRSTVGKREKSPGLF
jgi:hypothetical protein